MYRAIDRSHLTEEGRDGEDYLDRLAALTTVSMLALALRETERERRGVREGYERGRGTDFIVSSTVFVSSRSS
jgi:hypothetical protein